MFKFAELSSIYIQKYSFQNFLGQWAHWIDNFNTW